MDKFFYNMMGICGCILIIEGSNVSTILYASYMIYLANKWKVETIIK